MHSVCGDRPAAMNLVAERRRAAAAAITTTRRAAELGLAEPERKRICRRLETDPQEMIVCHPPSKYAVDYWNMDQDLPQNSPTEFFNPPIMKEKPHFMIFPDNEARMISQPCPRCIAGEPGHFGHITSL